MYSKKERNENLYKVQQTSTHIGIVKPYRVDFGNDVNEAIEERNARYSEICLEADKIYTINDIVNLNAKLSDFENMKVNQAWRVLFHEQGNSYFIAFTQAVKLYFQPTK
jgi:hypothetical protein